MAMGFGLLFLLVPLALLLGSTGGLIYVWVKVLTSGRTSDKGNGLACCGKCGYPARGAVNFACVECGADLREVGIVTAQQRKPMIGPAGFLALWTICLPVPALTLASVLIAIGPKQSISNESVTLSPNSGEYASVGIDNAASAGMAIWSLGQANLNTLSIEINGNNNQWEWLEINAATMTYDPSFTSVVPFTPGGTNSTSTANSTNPTTPGNPGTGSTTAAFDQSVLLGLMQAAGADPTKTEVVAEADELFILIQQFPAQGLQNIQPQAFTNTQSHQFGMEIPSLWWTVAVLLSVPALWILGILIYFIVRRRRSQLPAVQAERNPYGPARFAAGNG